MGFVIRSRRGILVVVSFSGKVLVERGMVGYKRQQEEPPQSFKSVKGPLHSEAQLSYMPMCASVCSLPHSNSGHLDSAQMNATG